MDASTSFSAPGTTKRNVLLGAGAAALLALGLAAGLSLRPAPSSSSVPPVAASVQAPAVPSEPKMLANDGAVPPPQPAAQAQARSPAPTAAVLPPARAPAPERVARAAPQPAQATAVCSRCGTVESVQAVKVKGQGSGVGAVAGGVVGGALANQLGHGNGKAALTILGAVGGAFGGNEVEKHVRAETMYDVNVRMQDGSLRTLRQQAAPAIGERVLVDGQTLRADQRGG